MVKFERNYRITQHNSPTTRDLEVNLSTGNFGFGGSQMKVPSNLMPFWYQNGGILARCDPDVKLSAG